MLLFMFEFTFIFISILIYLFIYILLYLPIKLHFSTYLFTIYIISYIHLLYPRMLSQPL